MFRRARLSLPREAQARPGLAVPRRAHALQLVAQLVGGRGQLRGRPRTLAVLEEQWRRTEYRGDDDLVFGHPPKGTPVDTSKLAKRFSPGPGSSGRSGRSTTFATRLSRTQPRPEIRRSTSRPERDTRKARSPSGTCTRPRCSSPVPPSGARIACSAGRRPVATGTSRWVLAKRGIGLPPVKA